jgi:hypothetical protein
MFQIDLNNYLKIQNKLWLRKNTPPSSWENIPYWELSLLIDDWIEEVEEERAANEKRDKEEKAAQRREEQKYKSAQPKFNMPKTKF